MLAYHGRGMSLDIEAAVRGDGVLLGMRVRVVADIGAYFLLTTSSAPFNAVRRITGPYHIPAVDLELLGAITNKTPTGAYRGTGSPEAAFCIERTMDLIARDLELDPAEVRRRNFIPADAFPYQSAAGLTYDSGQYLQGLDRALELLDYAGWRQKAGQRKPDEPLLGIGLATFTKSSGAAGDHRIESARMTIEPFGPDHRLYRDLAARSGKCDIVRSDRRRWAGRAPLAGTGPARRHGDRAFRRGDQCQPWSHRWWLSRVYRSPGSPSDTAAARLSALELCRRRRPLPGWASVQSPATRDAHDLLPAGDGGLCWGTAAGRR